MSDQYTSRLEELESDIMRLIKELESKEEEYKKLISSEIPDLCDNSVIWDKMNKARQDLNDD